MKNYNKKKEEMIKAFEDFEEKYGIDCNSIIWRIKKHGKYMTNQKLYFRHNSKLSFLQRFRSSFETILKLYDYYLTFDQSKTQLWTVTKKRTKLDKMIIKEGKRLLVQFEEINQTEKNLNQLLWRLHRYGVTITKYIIVPEITEKGGTVNYHYHIIIEFQSDVNRIRSNKKEKYRSLAYNPTIQKDLEQGWINNPTLSEIWKDITKDGSYRIKPEVIRKKEGVFYYLLSYMNKGIKYQSTDMLPYLYFALKSKKAYRIKGLKRIPKIKYKVLDEKRRQIDFKYHQIDFIDFDKIPIEYQKYYLQIYKNDILVEDKKIEQYFKMTQQQENGNQRLSNFDRLLEKNRLVTWIEIEKEKISESEIQKKLTEGDIFRTREGYRILL
jgi:hypothetical protein